MKHWLPGKPIVWLGTNTIGFSDFGQNRFALWVYNVYTFWSKNVNQSSVIVCEGCSLAFSERNWKHNDSVWVNEQNKISMKEKKVSSLLYYLFSVLTILLLWCKANKTFSIVNIYTNTTYYRYTQRLLLHVTRRFNQLRSQGPLY